MDNEMDNTATSDNLKAELHSIISNKKEIKWKKMTGEKLDVDYTILFPSFVADQVMDDLEKSVEYYTGDLTRVRIFGKWHQVPRQQVAYGDPGLKYKFSGTTIPAKQWLPVLESLRNVVEEVSGYKYNFVLVNKYRNGNDHIGEHRDDEKELDCDTPIASLSLGQQRTFVFKHRDARIKGKLKRNIPTDHRSDNMFLMSSPIPTIAILVVWFMFVTKWGPEYMKDKEPFNLKYIMIVYNIVQVIVNMYILCYILIARHVVNWQCTEVDYSNSYWGLTFLRITHLYFLLKLIDLLDTVFFVLRKKTSHLSFLHLYHHFGMVLPGWIGTRFIGGGHFYFLGMVNSLVHVMLYCYYLLTAYDNKYSKLLWLKKFITQAQLLQFVFLTFSFGQILFLSDCKFPKYTALILVPQNFFMMILFGEFYIRTYHLEPRRKKRELENKMQEMKEKSEYAQEKKDL